MTVDNSEEAAWTEEAAVVVFTIRFPPTLRHGRSREKQIRLESHSSADHIFKSIRKTGTFYEQDLLSHLLVAGPRGGVFVDVGAHIGNHSVFFGVTLADLVISIEPDAGSRRYLELNLEKNGVLFRILPVAIGSSSGPVTLLRDSSGNSGMTKVVDESREENTVTVESKTIDEVVSTLSQNETVNLIKVDVEGREVEVLRGAKATIQRSYPDIVVESDDHDRQREIHGLLTNAGYVLVGQFCATPTFHYCDRSKLAARINLVDRVWQKVQKLHQMSSIAGALLKKYS